MRLAINSAIDNLETLRRELHHRAASAPTVARISRVEETISFLNNILPDLRQFRETLELLDSLDAPRKVEP